MRSSIALLFVYCLLCAYSVQAQKKTASKKQTSTNVQTKIENKAEDKTTKKDSVVLKNSLKLLTRVGEQSVKLRWALEKSLGWKACNEYGFRVERYTLVRDTTWLGRPELTVLSDP